MRIAFYSNFINHHQIPLANAFNSLPGVEYIFVATTPFNENRAKMGYKDENSKLDFVLRTYENKNQEKYAHQLAKDADIVIVGSAPDSYMAERLDEGKITFHCSERYFKNGLSVKTLPRYFLSSMKHIKPYQNKPLYYLCSSAYTAKDVNTFTSLKNRCFKWAYFTEVNEQNENKLIFLRKDNPKPVLLWAGRFIDCKHPDAAVRLAYRLKEQGYDFYLDVIGGGDMDNRLKSSVKSLGLEDTVRFIGFLPPDVVRTHMESADVFLFTSDFNEGWGAVLNEAMSSGCAVVASHACGATPFLVRDGVNGYIYKYGCEDELLGKVKKLIDNPEIRTEIGVEAYRSMVNMWNPGVAAERLIKLNEAIKSGNATSLYNDGPCSPAPILGNGWYKK